MGNRGDKRAKTAPDVESPAEQIRLLKAAQHNPTLFAPVYEQYVDRIYAYCRYRVGDQDAEDLTSQVFVKALTGLAGYRGGSVAAWLFRIAHNCVVDHLRYRRPQVALEDVESVLPATGTDLLERVEQAEQWETLRSLILTLPDEQINLLTLKMVSGLNASEIAQVIGKSAIAVRVELHRILKRLRARYQTIAGETNP